MILMRRMRLFVCYLFSSLYHSNSGFGTAVASHCSVPMRPTWVSEFWVFFIVGGSAESQKKTLVNRSYNTQIINIKHLFNNSKFHKHTFCIFPFLNSEFVFGKSVSQGWLAGMSNILWITFTLCGAFHLLQNLELAVVNDVAFSWQSSS